MRNLLFPFHLEVGQQGLITYAKTSFGTGGFSLRETHLLASVAIKHLINECYNQSVFSSLVKTPSLSAFPFINPSVSPGERKLFDLHFEIGTITQSLNTITLFYILNEFDNPYEQTERQFQASLKLNEEMKNIIDDIEGKGILTTLFTNPGRSVYPFTNGSSSPSSYSSSSGGKKIHRAVPVDDLPKEKDLPRQYPNDLIGVNYPDCTKTCTSMYHFGKSKCAGMCSWRPEV